MKERIMGRGKDRRRSVGFVAIAIALIMALAVCAGCASPSPSNERASSASVSSASASADGTRTITDALGREVKVPAKVERVAIVQVPILSTYVAYQGGTTKGLVGVSKNIIGSMKGSVLMDMIPDLQNLSSDCFADGKLNMEELVKLKADVIIIPNQNAELAENLQKAGLNAVAFNVAGDPKALYVEWLRMLEDLFDEPGKMDACIVDGEAMYQKVEKAVGDASDKPSILTVFGYSNGNMQVTGSGSRATFWYQYANAANAAEEINGIDGTSMEQVVAWNPDIILLPGIGQCQYLPPDLIGNTIEGADFSALSAVQNGKVYCNGLGSWSWFTPSVDWPLTMEWLAKVTHPDLTSDIDVVADTKAYYKSYYNVDLSDAQMSDIFPDYAGI
ncbi:ABC transporter substrate-binding protein [Curtanaerobium respiraculi]|uniref:ABC transporter substrate-binding protein n=1 Tax=Curtanaerobium respiraculi TaxID=2949669 RepID=UPI0024B35376|nr:ABC transporter substrate-binding protein [Curtanaerobium respiraculi]